MSISDRQIPESYIDLRHIWSVKQSTLATRVIGMSAIARSSLFEHLFTFFTRKMLDAAPTCPTCGTQVPLVASGAEDED